MVLSSDFLFMSEKTDRKIQQDRKSVFLIGEKIVERLRKFHGLFTPKCLGSKILIDDWLSFYIILTSSENRRVLSFL